MRKITPVRVDAFISAERQKDDAFDTGNSPPARKRVSAASRFISKLRIKSIQSRSTRFKKDEHEKDKSFLHEPLESANTLSSLYDQEAPKSFPGHHKVSFDLSHSNKEVISNSSSIIVQSEAEYSDQDGAPNVIRDSSTTINSEAADDRYLLSEDEQSDTDIFNPPVVKRKNIAHLLGIQHRDLPKPKARAAPLESQDGLSRALLYRKNVTAMLGLDGKKEPASNEYSTAFPTLVDKLNQKLENSSSQHSEATTSSSYTSDSRNFPSDENDDEYVENNRRAFRTKNIAAHLGLDESSGPSKYGKPVVLREYPDDPELLEALAVIREYMNVSQDQTTSKEGKSYRKAVKKVRNILSKTKLRIQTTVKNVHHWSKPIYDRKSKSVSDPGINDFIDCVERRLELEDELEKRIIIEKRFQQEVKRLELEPVVVPKANASTETETMIGNNQVHPIAALYASKYKVVDLVRSDFLTWDHITHHNQLAIQNSNITLQSTTPRASTIENTVQTSLEIEIYESFDIPKTCSPFRTKTDVAGVNVDGILEKIFEDEAFVRRVNKEYSSNREAHPTLFGIPTISRAKAKDTPIRMISRDEHLFTSSEEDFCEQDEYSSKSVSCDENNDVSSIDSFQMTDASPFFQHFIRREYDYSDSWDAPSNTVMSNGAHPLEPDFIETCDFFEIELLFERYRQQVKDEKPQVASTSSPLLGKMQLAALKAAANEVLTDGKIAKWEKGTRGQSQGWSWAEAQERLGLRRRKSDKNIKSIDSFATKHSCSLMPNDSNSRNDTWDFLVGVSDRLSKTSEFPGLVHYIFGDSQKQKNMANVDMLVDGSAADELLTVNWDYEELWDSGNE